MVITTNMNDFMLILENKLCIWL